MKNNARRNMIKGGFLRIFSLLLALHILNFSMDTKDLEPFYVPEDLSINDIESISEFVTEIVFGISNAFSEHDEPDTDSEKLINLYIVNISVRQALLFDTSFIHINNQFSEYIELNRSQLIHEIIPPPPKG